MKHIKKYKLFESINIKSLIEDALIETSINLIIFLFSPIKTNLKERCYM